MSDVTAFGMYHTVRGTGWSIITNDSLVWHDGQQVMVMHKYGFMCGTLNRDTARAEWYVTVNLDCDIRAGMTSVRFKDEDIKQVFESKCYATGWEPAPGSPEIRVLQVLLK